MNRYRAFFLFILCLGMNLRAQELYIGTAVADITPKLPVALMGQFNLRIADTIETPLTANVIALESRDGNLSIDAAIMISCDVVEIPEKLLEMVRDEVHKQIPMFDVKKIFMTAIHTHTAPVLENGFQYSFRYQIPKNGVTQVEEYDIFFIQRVTEAAVKAWKNRHAGSVSWGLGHAAIAYNRRAVYSKVMSQGSMGEGTAQMYGNTNLPEFLNLEGMEDHDVNALFFWDKTGKLIAMTINVPCPAQEVENRLAVNADYWHPVREKLKKRFGPDLCVLGWIGAAGDQSPRPIYRKAAEERMIRLRNLSPLDEIARRIVLAVEEAYQTVKDDRYSNVQLIHKIETLSLPMRLVTEKEYIFSKSERDEAAAEMAADSSTAGDVLARMTWNRDVVDRYERQKNNPNPKLDAEIHVLRIGDVAICTNQFELFTDYGIRIQARSNALQTFVVQLAAGAGSYLPTEKAVKGGGYSAVIQSDVVSPEGGQILVDRTTELINSMWPMDQPQTTTSTFTVDVSKPGPEVAPICRGQQIEEFNYQFQGGLYAQLINNPSFEELRDPVSYWTLVKSGSSNANIVSQSINDTKMLNKYQNHCIKLEINSVASGDVGMANGGYWGIKLENNTKYKVSFWAKKGPNFNGTLKAKLESNEGTVYAQSADLKPTANWQHFTCDLTTTGISNITGTNRFVLLASATGDLFFDVVTVMPPTWKDRPNGLRPDLAEKLDALKFKFIQFPGGCTAESYKMDTCWNWKNSIGPLEERPGSTRNRWEYKNDLYFGLDEHMQLCEDLGAEAIYTCSAGISENTGEKKWFGICPLDKMQPIIDDILDLIEYCNGSSSTTWGAKRASNGHPAPYNLKYIEIGNENGWETAKEYNPRYSMIHDSILAHYPEMKIMYNGFRQKNVTSHTSGNSVDFVDEHFYLKDLSVLYNKYDSIDPACKKICVAEYASSIKGNGGDVIGNFGDALGDAVFMLGCEKNSERLWWTGYGNYGGLVDHGNFGPCIVWNDAVSNFASPSYYMQKMLFTDNQGSRVLSFSQNTTNCYWSASVDNESGKNDILLKVVNNKSTSESVNITLKGAGKVNQSGHSTTLTGTPDDENSLTNPTKIVPLAGTFKADSSFNYTFPAYSVTVLRVKLIQ
ncbi:MAG: alpha-L-arabinofuranosidase C-terminal domain-containing protein [Bacteroidota bacterium]